MNRANIQGHHTIMTVTVSSFCNLFSERSYTLTSAILKVDVVCVVVITSNRNVITTELSDLLYNQCIDNTCCHSFVIHPTDRIMVCKIIFVSTRENRGKSCLECKKE